MWQQRGKCIFKRHALFLKLPEGFPFTLFLIMKRIRYVTACFEKLLFYHFSQLTSLEVQNIISLIKNDCLHKLF